MLADLIRRLSGNTAEESAVGADDARIAVAGILVAAARADHHYDASEKDQIERALALRYALSPLETVKLREQGEAAEAAATDFYRFTSVIKQSVPHEERASVLEALWRIVLADRKREKHEEAMMRRVTDLLGLDDRDSVHARQRVEASLT